MTIAAASSDHLHDFDFLFGEWQVENRRLVAALAGSTGWYGFPATTRCFPVLGGTGNVEQYSAPARDIVGLTLRLFDPTRQEWSLYWANRATGLLEPPVIGRFAGDVGEFTGRSVHEQRPVQVRFTWRRVAETCARWEQAFSADDGVTWETNWTMEFTRISPLPVPFMSYP